MAISKSMNVKYPTWIPKTDAQIEAEIERVKNTPDAPPRPISLVKFADDSMFRKYVNDTEDEDMSNYKSLLFLGPVKNQSGHGAYINLKSNTTHIIDIEELVELTDDET